MFRYSLGTLAIVTCLTIAAAGQTERDGGIGVDGQGREVLESIYIPPIPNAPFTLTLETEWTRPLLEGGTFTIVNKRPIARDSNGRIYQERWLLTPKGSNLISHMSYIQIFDPRAETFWECNVLTKVCELNDWKRIQSLPDTPIRTESSRLPDGRGTRTREDVGQDTVAGLPTRVYRDTIVIDAGALGNSKPMTYVRDLRYNPELHLNLSSVLHTPRVGEQRFTVTEITTAEPNARLFEPPTGYTMVDKRQEAISAHPSLSAR